MKNKVASSDAISASSANHNNADVLENDSNFRNRSRVKPTTPKAPSAPNRAYEERKKSLLYLKLGVVAGLVVLKAFIGFGAYEVVRMSEHRQFTQAYNTLINNIIPSTNIGMSSMLLKHRYICVLTKQNIAILSFVRNFFNGGRRDGIGYGYWRHIS